MCKIRWRRIIWFGTPPNPTKKCVGKQYFVYRTVQVGPNNIYRTSHFRCEISFLILVDSSWNVMAHGDAREGKWRGNCRMEWLSSTLHTTSEHGVSSIATADAHTSAASSRLHWSPRRFKWTSMFRRKTKSGFCACAITFQLAPTSQFQLYWNFCCVEYIKCSIYIQPDCVPFVRKYTGSCETILFCRKNGNCAWGRSHPTVMIWYIC